jgi:hypothetical protein
MPLEEFEPAIPGDKQPQAYALDHADTELVTLLHELLFTCVVS